MLDRKKLTAAIVADVVRAVAENPDVLFDVVVKLAVEVLRTHSESKGAIVNALVSQVLAPFGGRPSLTIHWRETKGGNNV